MFQSDSVAYHWLMFKEGILAESRFLHYIHLYLNEILFPQFLTTTKRKRKKNKSQYKKHKQREKGRDNEDECTILSILASAKFLIKSTCTSRIQPLCNVKRPFFFFAYFYIFNGRELVWVGVSAQGTPSPGYHSLRGEHKRVLKTTDSWRFIRK